MKTRCPCCGAENSLDTLIAHDGAREVLRLLYQLSGKTGQLAVRYIGLFRPAKTSLSFDRMAKLLAEIIPDMQSGKITRNGVVHEAPAEAWITAFESCLNARDAGSLKTPLKSHGYLYEILANWRGQTADVVATPANRKSAASKMEEGIRALEELR